MKFTEAPLLDAGRINFTYATSAIEGQSGLVVLKLRLTDFDPQLTRGRSTRLTIASSLVEGTNCEARHRPESPVAVSDEGRLSLIAIGSGGRRKVSEGDSPNSAR